MNEHDKQKLHRSERRSTKARKMVALRKKKAKLTQEKSEESESTYYQPGFAD